MPGSLVIYNVKTGWKSLLVKPWLGAMFFCSLHSCPHVCLLICLRVYYKGHLVFVMFLSRHFFILFGLLSHSPVESAWQAEAWKLLMRQKSFTETRSWSLAFSLTHTLIFHSHVSLEYGSMCSPLVLSYYKCLLRLNSDIAKVSVPTGLEQWSLSKTLGLEFSTAPGITLSLWIKVRSLPFTGICHHQGRKKFLTVGEIRIDT